MNHSDGPFDPPIENGIATLITWGHGGKEVLVEGSWDNWTSRLRSKITVQIILASFWNLFTKSGLSC